MLIDYALIIPDLKGYAVIRQDPGYAQKELTDHVPDHHLCQCTEKWAKYHRVRIIELWIDHMIETDSQEQWLELIWFSQMLFFASLVAHMKVKLDISEMTAPDP